MRPDAESAAVAAVWEPRYTRTARSDLHPLPLVGLDGSNPLAFLAAIGMLVVCDQLSRSTNPPRWLDGRVALSWGTTTSPDAPYHQPPGKLARDLHERGVKRVPNVPVLHLPGEPPAAVDIAAFLEERLAQSVEEHSSAGVVQMLTDEEHPFPSLIRERCSHLPMTERAHLDWVTALACESAPKAASQLQTVRRDYLIGNLRSVMQRTKASHIFRSLFEAWDYADALDNQSLHWEPSEDRRHAYQWYQPNGDPTRKKRGGMLGANRLALEAWPLFPSFADGGDGERVRTRGFRGNRAKNTFWIWPLWSSRLTPDGVASMLSLPGLEPADLTSAVSQRDRNHGDKIFRARPAADPSSAVSLRDLGVTVVYRSQRILVGKTPNLTPAEAIA